MKLNNIPKVQLDKNGGHKYILVSIESESKKTTNILFGDKTKEYHSNLLSLIRIKYGDSFTYTCLGGGYIHIDEQDKTITTNGESTAYGKVDIDLVKKLLETKYPNFKLKQN